MSQSVEQIADACSARQDAMQLTSVEMSEGSSYLKEITNFDSHGRESVGRKTESNWPTLPTLPRLTASNGQYSVQGVAPTLADASTLVGREL
jgi:hypothetical protein